jgi:alpha-L-fucosidase
LEELQSVYHGTVGHNSFLMMDFAPNQDGLIAPDQEARYLEFGNWQRSCYESEEGRVGVVERELGSAPNPLGREELTLHLVRARVMVHSAS